MRGVLQRTVVPGVVAKLPPKPKKHKETMSIGESFTFLAKSPYIRDLAALVRILPTSYCDAWQAPRSEVATTGSGQSAPPEISWICS